MFKALFNLWSKIVNIHYLLVGVHSVTEKSLTKSKNSHYEYNSVGEISNIIIHQFKGKSSDKT